MVTEYKGFGEAIENQTWESLTIPAAKKTLDAVENNPFCEFIELRKLDDDYGSSEMIVIDCLSDGVPAKNKVGIKYRERLALRFFQNEKIFPQVRALRKEFPETYHQNHVINGEPASLCIYSELWSSVVRSWTPEKHLRDIRNWLEQTACGTLHGEDQPLEPFFFEGCRFRMILPVDFEDKIGRNEWALIAKPRIIKDDSSTLQGYFVPTKDSSAHSSISLYTEEIQLPPLVHGRIERTPATLGELHDQFSSRGVDLASLLFDKIRVRSEGVGLSKSEKEFTLLVLIIPLQRSDDQEIERSQKKGFCLCAGLVTIGVNSGILNEHDGKYWFTPAIGGEVEISQEWRSIAIEPMELLKPFTRELARNMSGIESEGPIGVLAGAGSLGSAMHNIWTRQGWGKWHLIDPDLVNPHNLARHAALEFQNGTNKVDALRVIEHNIYPHEHETPDTFAESAVDFSIEAIVTTIDNVELIVDATTTLNVPRELAVRESASRSISTFITPSGLGAVLLAEDSHRDIRLDVLEAQYYRTVINNYWGEHHLEGNNGSVWVGAGCRDMSAIIPYDLIQLHASTLARHIRIKSESSNSSINIWNCNPETGEILAVSESPSIPINVNLDAFTLVWSEAIKEKVRVLREESLPVETGGILLGYFDLELSRIYVVDVYPAPDDSQEEATGFIRGVEKLQEKVDEAMHRTANIVGYLGEWHSHPPGASANPSGDDIYLLSHLANALNNDGLPALMLIVGEQDENWLYGEVIN